MRQERVQVATFGKARVKRRAVSFEVIRVLQTAGRTWVGRGRGRRYVVPPDDVQGLRPTI